MRSKIELYLLILMLIVCAVAFWEAGRACLRTGSNAVRLQGLSARHRAAPTPKPKTSHKPRTLTKAECRELSAYCETDPAEPLPPAEAARFAELLAKLDQGSVKVSVPRSRLKPAKQPKFASLPARSRAEQVLLPLHPELHIVVSRQILRWASQG